MSQTRHESGHSDLRVSVRQRTDYYTIGWISFLLAIIISKKLRLTGPAVVILGLCVIRLLSATFSPLSSGIAGGTSLGLAFTLMGLDLHKASSTSYGGRHFRCLK